MEKITFVKDCIYAGRVTHTRFSPFKHRFNYNVTYFWVDIKEKNSHKFFSWDWFSLFSFFEKDFGDMERDKSKSLFSYYKSELKKHKILNIKNIKVLCLPRFFNYVFNPISVFICYTIDKRPNAIILEVSNTFGERHSYVSEISANNLFRTEKYFHVSPFFDVKGEYKINFSITKKIVRLNINYFKNKNKLLNASFIGIKKTLDRPNLSKLIFINFYQNILVTLGIHYEALKLFVKGAIYKKKPKKPEKFITKF